MPNLTATMPEEPSPTAPSGDDDRGLGETSPVQARATTTWDIAGVFVLLCIAFALTDLLAAGFDRFHRPRQLLWVTLLTGLAAVALAWRAHSRDPQPVSTIPARLTEVWRRPPAGWPAFVLGWVMTLPLTWLYAPLHSDADSMRVVASIRHVQRGNFDHLIETQDSLGPHLFLGPAAAVAGWVGLRLVTIVSMQLLAAFVAWLAYRFSGSLIAAAAASLALLSIAPFISRVLYLPMYPTMLLLGSVGTWLAYRAIGEGARWPYAAGAALSLTLAFEAQAVGQLLLAVPLLLLVTAPALSVGLRRLAPVYGFMVIFNVPRLLINISDGGLSSMRSNRTDYWTSKGYLVDIQSDHWGYSGLDESYFSYLESYPGRFLESLGEYGWIAPVVGLTALIAVRGKPRYFAIAFTALIVGAMTVKTIQTFDRYFSPLWPAASLLAALVVGHLIRHRQIAARALGVAVLLVLLVVSATRFYDTAAVAQRRTERKAANQYEQVAATIDDGKGLIGSRPHTIISADIDVPTYGGQFLTEDEFATYLTWPSDDAVIAMMEEHDIGWVLVRRKTSLETDYHNTWLMPNHGNEARHVEMLDDSPNFCFVLGAPSVLLYRVGQCP